MTRPAAGWLPYLILPLGVALLEYHGLQFWTLAVTGAWPGWFTLGFWAAWSAWGWAVLLELGALWCWMQSRAGGPWGVTGWTAGGAVLTSVLCVAALWNVAAPVRQNLVVSQLMAGERERVGAQEEAAQGILLRSDKPYRRLVDNLERSQARAAQLFQDALTAAKEGRATSDAQARLVLLLQVACVVLGQLLVVAAARAMGTTNGEGDGQEDQSEPGGILGGAYERYWRRAARRDREEPDEIADGAHPAGPEDWPVRDPVQSAANDTTAWRDLPEGKAPPAAQEVTSAVLAAGAEEAVSPGPTSPAAGPAEPVNFFAGTSGLAADVSYSITQAESAGGKPQSGAESVEATAESAGEEPPPETPEPALTARVRKAREALEAAFPGVKARERAQRLNVLERDLSLLRGHEALAQKRSQELESGTPVRAATRIISGPALAKIEQALAAMAPRPVAGAGRVHPL